MLQEAEDELEGQEEETSALSLKDGHSQSSYKVLSAVSGESTLKTN
jgi:hypothetical protein